MAISQSAHHVIHLLQLLKEVGILLQLLFCRRLSSKRLQQQAVVLQ
jgi:hypothetical protein